MTDEEYESALSTEGYLVAARDNELIRTINKPEQKQRKLFMAQATEQWIYREGEEMAMDNNMNDKLHDTVETMI